MSDKSVRRSALVLAAVLALAGAVFAGTAFAADPKLDEANDAVTKAIALLKAADNPALAGKGEFAGHRIKAIEKLQAAQAEIAKAKAFADKPPPAPPAPPPKKPPIKKAP
jgi:hypothetical protein